MSGYVVIFEVKRDSRAKNLRNTALDFAAACPGDITAPKTVLVSIRASDLSCRCANFVSQIFMPAVNSDAPDINQASWEGRRCSVAHILTIDWAYSKRWSSARGSRLCSCGSDSIRTRPSVRTQIFCHSRFKLKCIHQVFVNAKVQ